MKIINGKDLIVMKINFFLTIIIILHHFYFSTKAIELVPPQFQSTDSNNEEIKLTEIHKQDCIQLHKNHKCHPEFTLKWTVVRNSNCFADKNQIFEVYLSQATDCLRLCKMHFLCIAAKFDFKKEKCFLYHKFAFRNYCLLDRITTTTTFYKYFVAICCRKETYKSISYVKQGDVCQCYPGFGQIKQNHHESWIKLDWTHFTYDIHEEFSALVYKDQCESACLNDPLCIFYRWTILTVGVKKYKQCHLMSNYIYTSKKPDPLAVTSISTEVWSRVLCRNISHVSKLAPKNYDNYPNRNCVFAEKLDNFYTGTVNSTIKGGTCLRWDSLNLNTNLLSLFGNDLSHSFCRNYDDVQPWCYIHPDGLIDYCNVPQCESFELTLIRNEELTMSESLSCFYVDEYPKQQCIFPMKAKFIKREHLFCSTYEYYKFKDNYYSAMIMFHNCMTDNDCSSLLLNNYDKTYYGMSGMNVDDCHFNRNYTFYQFVCCKSNSEMQNKNIDPAYGVDCYRRDVVGNYYNGKINVTATNRKCLPWNKMGLGFYQAHNYCRNPDNSAMGPWCYFDYEHKLFQSCTVPTCDDYDIQTQTDYDNLLIYDKTFQKSKKCDFGLSLMWLDIYKLRSGATSSPTDPGNSTDNIAHLNTLAFNKTTLANCQFLCYLNSECEIIFFNEDEKICTIVLKERRKNYPVHMYRKYFPIEPTSTSLYLKKIVCGKLLNQSSISNYFLNQSLNEFDCRILSKTEDSYKYNGTVSVTRANATCIEWKSSNYAMWNSHVANLKHNHCRNFNADPNGPWCLVNPYGLYQYCHVLYCYGIENVIINHREYDSTNKYFKVSFDGSNHIEFSSNAIPEMYAINCTYCEEIDIFIDELVIFIKDIKEWINEKCHFQCTLLQETDTKNIEFYVNMSEIKESREVLDLFNFLNQNDAYVKTQYCGILSNELWVALLPMVLIFLLLITVVVCWKIILHATVEEIKKFKYSMS